MMSIKAFNTKFTYSKGSQWILQEFAHLLHEKLTKGTYVPDSWRNLKLSCDSNPRVLIGKDGQLARQIHS